jgi:septum formation protein
MRELILASTSPYRRTLLARLGLPFAVASPHVDETPQPGELPARLAARLARLKAVTPTAGDALVIGSDQVASLDGARLGKPGSHAEALAQLESCQGKSVVFYTAVALSDRRDGRLLEHVDLTRVDFGSRPRAELERYVEAEPAWDCAGGFKVEGLGIALFEAIESKDPTALIGLPLIWLTHALRDLGLDPLTPSASAVRPIDRGMP